MGPDDGEGHGMRKARVFGQVLGVQGMGIEDVTVQVDPDGDEEVLVVSVRPDAPASGRTDTTRTSSSPSRSIRTVTSSMTMPWTPNTCPNTLALRMPCPSPSSGPIARPKLRQGAACRPKAAGQAPTTTSQEPTWRTSCMSILRRSRRSVLRYLRGASPADPSEDHGTADVDRECAEREVPSEPGSDRAVHQ